MDVGDQFVDCHHADCGFPNRPGAVYCAQCGRELPVVSEPDPSPPPPVPISRFLVASGGPVTRLDHLGVALSWCLAIAGIAVLVASVGRIASKFVGI